MLESVNCFEFTFQMFFRVNQISCDLLWAEIFAYGFRKCIYRREKGRKQLQIIQKFIKSQPNLTLKDKLIFKASQSHYYLNNSCQRYKIKKMMSSSSQFRIRNATLEETKIFIQWGIRQGWNQGQDDGRIFFEADPHGFFVGQIQGKIITTISAVRYQNNIGFISFFVTRPDFRGQGYGRKVFQYALKYLEGCNIILDADPGVCSFYEKKGFKKQFQIDSYSGHISCQKIDDKNVLPLNQVPLSEIIQFQTQVSPFERDNFLKKFYFQTPDSLSLAYRESGVLKGYGLIRRIYSRYRIGPLYADNFEIAEKLFLNLAKYAEGKGQVILNIIQSNEGSILLSKKYGMKILFSMIRMMTKKIDSDLAENKVYSGLSSDIG